MNNNLPYILLIETSTEACSVAISLGDKVISQEYIKEPKAHASMLAPLIETTLKRCNIEVKDLDAVAVSEGPGSYTGLRVGVSTAKGICFGKNILLIGISTLTTLAYQSEGQYDLIVPMIDARRMEVFTATYNSDYQRINEIRPEILDENSFSDILSSNRVLFIGDGVEKFKNICNKENGSFDTSSPKASAMATPAFEMWTKKEFKDVAYFEPFYLKDFVAGISKKSIL